MTEVPGDEAPRNDETRATPSVPPVPPAQSAPHATPYVAPDDVAADPEQVGPAPARPLGDDELSRTIEREVASGSTLEAILLLESELRRRQGLSPVEDVAEGSGSAEPAQPAEPIRAR